jgi:hypothetical protein
MREWGGGGTGRRGVRETEKDGMVVGIFCIFSNWPILTRFAPIVISDFMDAPLFSNKKRKTLKIHVLKNRLQILFMAECVIGI